jgi:hypothetical protein
MWKWERGRDEDRHLMEDDDEFILIISVLFLLDTERVYFVIFPKVT